MGTPSARYVRRVAVAADVDPRTVEAYLRGDAVRPSSRTCIERAIAELDEKLAERKSAK